MPDIAGIHPKPCKISRKNPADCKAGASQLRDLKVLLINLTKYPWRYHAFASNSL